MMRTCPCSTVLSLTRTNFHWSSTCYTTCSFVGRSATATRTTRFSKSSATNRTPTSYTWRTIDIFTRTDTVINKSLDGSSFNIYLGLFDKSVMWCATHDHGKFMTIMHMLHKMHVLDVILRCGFGVCDLDGVIFHNGIEITDTKSNTSFCVNNKYEAFMYVFWTVANMHKIFIQHISRNSTSCGRTTWCETVCIFPSRRWRRPTTQSYNCNRSSPSTV